MNTLLKWMTTTVSCVAASMAAANEPDQGYRVTFEHRYDDAIGAAIWDTATAIEVRTGHDATDTRFPNDQVYFVSLTPDGKAHVFFHAMNMAGMRWLSASRTFALAPAHIEEIVLEDKSKLFVVAKPVQDTSQ